MVGAGVGTVTATAFAAAVEDPANFRISRAMGAWVGLTPRRYQSGEVDNDGHISRRGDKPRVKITLLEVRPEHLPKRLMIHKPMKIGGKIHWTTERFRG
ncbi:MAG: hypothetical protein EOQ56_23785 [Mesorhizobium sp.]|nr:MAG: hypothetical protein EOQ56_23785 [Mesorhizobium sp.]